MLVGDKILVGATIAVDVDAKDVGDGAAMAVEGGAGNLYAAAHLRLAPAIVNVGKRNTANFSDGVHQPDVFLEKCGRGHG